MLGSGGMRTCMRSMLGRGDAAVCCVSNAVKAMAWRATERMHGANKHCTYRRCAADTRNA
jgi:nitrite reductase/ring-hydroxylating ferredoxin subunit